MRFFPTLSSVLRPTIVATTVTVALLGGCHSSTSDRDLGPSAELSDSEDATDGALEPTQPLPTSLDAHVRKYVAQYGQHWADFRFHGAIVVARGDTVAVNEAFGTADLVSDVPNRTDTVFRMGTLSAQLVAGAIMRLVERGDLQLDDTVDSFLPQWPRGDAITIEHLLTHQSGIPNFTDMRGFETWMKGPRTLDATLGLFRDRSPLNAPGEDTNPSNSNYVLLGAILEAATGLPHDEAVRQLVLAPLHMSHTHYATTAQSQAVGMLYREDETLELATAVHPSAFGPAGGWLSTTEDLLRWVRGLRDGTLLSAEGTERLQGRAGEGLGFGWAPATVAGREAVTWPGLIDGFSASVLYIPADDTTIIVLCNAEVIPAGQVVEDIAQLAYGNELPARHEPQDVPVPWSELEPIAGRYQLTRGTEDMLIGADPTAMESLADVFVRASDEQLVLDVPGHGNKRMHPLGKGRFFFKDRVQTTARLVWRYERSPLLVLETSGVELRFVKADDTSPTRAPSH